MEQKAEFIKKWKPIPAGYNGQWDEMESDLDTLLKEVAEAQREKCSQNLKHLQRIECKANEQYIHESDATFDIMNTSLVTDSATRRAAK